MKRMITIFIVLGWMLGLAGISEASAKGKDHGGKHGHPAKAFKVKQGHPAPVKYVGPAKVQYVQPVGEPYVVRTKRSFYSPYYVYSPYYSPTRYVAVNTGWFVPAPKVLVSPTIFTPAVVEPAVPKYYFFPPLYIPPSSLFSLNIGL